MPDAIREDWKIITRGVAEIIPEADLVDKLTRAKKERRALKVKVGFDPTAPHVHLGWTVILRKMRQFQDLGHEVTFLFGDFTAMIGDPSGRSKTRRQLSREEVLENARDYEKQIYKVLDPQRTKIRFNSEWLAAMSSSDVVRLAGHYTVARMLERDDFQKRFAAREPISIHEFLYPLMQGYDSVALQCDLELGGSDQKFNLLVGRDLMRDYGLEPQATLTMPLLVGLDGEQKMSQSLGNYVGITEPPREMFGKLMSIPDGLIVDYLTLLTDVPMEEIEQLERSMKEGANPRDVKARLAREIITLYHDAGAAREAEEEFNRMFREKGLPDEIPEFEVASEGGTIPLFKVLGQTGLCRSNSDARRQIQQGAVSINGERVGDVEAALSAGAEVLLKVGKRRFGKVRVK
ncbi:MAG TPA: tyrosine--tRNA ligase [Firmicutes bacterium]|nr:tyrosine--tRNA ligase [Bacillota bacterium]